jgi:hypothetical protein
VVTLQSYKVGGLGSVPTDGMCGVALPFLLQYTNKKFIETVYREINPKNAGTCVFEFK